MKVCKKILQLLSIFAVVFPVTATGTEFRQIDFERLLNAHPMMKNYDPETGRFKNTPSEIVPVEVLEERIASITADIGRLEKKKMQLVAASLQALSASDDSSLWAEISLIDRQIEGLRKAAEPIRELREDGGVPGFDKLLAVSSGLAYDIISAQAADDRVVFNKLPRFRSLPPKFAGRDLKHFFFTRDASVLTDYLAGAGLVGLMFSQADNTILYYGKE